MTSKHKHQANGRGVPSTTDLHNQATQSKQVHFVQHKLVRYADSPGACCAQVLVELQKPVIRRRGLQQLLVLLFQASQGGTPALPCAVQPVLQHMDEHHNVLVAHQGPGGCCWCGGPGSCRQQLPAAQQNSSSQLQYSSSYSNVSVLE